MQKVRVNDTQTEAILKTTDSALKAEELSVKHAIGLPDYCGKGQQELRLERRYRNTALGKSVTKDPGVIDNREPRRN